jgi:hypothetical protein
MKPAPSKLYSFFEKLWRFENSDFTKTTDFKGTFKQYLYSQWKQMAVVALYKSFSSIYFIVFPLALAYIINQRDISKLWLLLIVGLITFAVSNIGSYFENKWVMSEQNALITSASKILVEADPVEHKTLSVGKTVSKMQAFGRGFSVVVSMITYNFMETIISVVSIVIVFFSFDRLLGMALFVSFALQLFFFSKIRYTLSKEFKPFDIFKRDESNKASLVLITQKEYVRTTFATDIMYANFLDKAKSMFIHIRTTHMTYEGYSTLVSIVQLLSMILVVYFLILKNYDPIIVLALATSFNRSTSVINSFGRILSIFTENWIDITDSWEFIQQNSKQTFPVLEDSEVAQKV